MSLGIQAAKLNNLHIVFRTDASHQIGTGHVVRCLTLAEFLRDRGANCHFICKNAPGNLVDLCRNRGFPVIELNYSCVDSQERRWETTTEMHCGKLDSAWKKDSEATISALCDIEPDWLVVDHYGFDERWESMLRPRCRRIMAIDDLANRQHDCDLILDQNMVADFANRYSSLVPVQCGKMLGPKYALLQRQYVELCKSVPRKQGLAKRVLVYFGGADSQNVTGRTIAAFSALRRDDVFMDVVANPAGPHYDNVRNQVEKEDAVTLYNGLPSLAPLMAKADVAVGAGGATTWERCCVGLPSLVVTIADNQREIAAELHNQGIIRWLGEQNDVSVSKLAAALEEVFDQGIDPSWSEGCQQLVDGQGTMRVSRTLLLAENTPLFARLARLEDESLILEWANDPITRRNALVPGTISSDTHRAWFRKRLYDTSHCRIYVIESEDGLAVGQVRFQLETDSWEIHYGLDVKFRGRGIGSRLLSTALQKFRVDIGESDPKVFGRVKPQNKPSRKIFMSLGFYEEPDGSELIYRQEGRS